MGKQLLLVTKLLRTEVNIISQQTITCSKSTIEILEKGWQGCSKLTITLGRHNLTSVLLFLLLILNMYEFAKTRFFTKTQVLVIFINQKVSLPRLHSFD